MQAVVCAPIFCFGSCADGGRSKPLPYDGVYLNRLSVRRFFCFGSRADLDSLPFSACCEGEGDRRVVIAVNIGAAVNYSPVYPPLARGGGPSARMVVG